MNLQQKLNDYFKGEAEILSIGVNHVVVVQSPEELRDSFSEEARKEIVAIKLGLKQNIKLYQVDSLIYKGGFAVFNLRRCEYADLLYLRGNPGLIKPAVLTGAGLFLTSDDHLVLDQRSATIGTYKNCLHVHGGLMEMEKDAVPLDAVVREGCEELGLEQGELSEEQMKLLCVTAEPKVGYCQVSYVVSLSLTQKDLLHRKGDGEGEKVYVRNDPKELSTFFLDTWERFVPTGLALCLLYGARTFGNSWAEDILASAQGKRFASPK